MAFSRFSIQECPTRRNLNFRRSRIFAKIFAMTSAFGFAPCGPPWWSRILAAPASMSRAPMASMMWTRDS
jgi:hypothetical protein